MKTIAISIDEATLKNLDCLVDSAMKVGSRGPGIGRRMARINRSWIVRQALREFLARCEGMRRDERETKAYAKHRRLIGRQVKALVCEQANPRTAA